MTEKNLLSVNATKELLELKKQLHDRTCRKDDALLKIRNITEQNGLSSEFFDLFENYKTQDELTELIKDATDAGLDRLYYFLSWVSIKDVEIMYIDNYWNCDHVVWYNEIMDKVDEIIDDYWADADIYD